MKLDATTHKKGGGPCPVTKEGKGEGNLQVAALLSKKKTTYQKILEKLGAAGEVVQI